MGEEHGRTPYETREILFYKTDNGDVRIEIFLYQENLWLTQATRLREPENFFGKDYFEEQLERIRDIRSSERRFYQKITDIYSQCSADYDVNSPITKEFFATVQNKLHYAVTHHTAAEIVYGRADSTKPNMGLTTWKNAPQGRANF